MEQLSKNFTLSELIASGVASRLKLDNTPNPVQQNNLHQLAVKILQPIRDKWGKPIIVTSGFRSEKVNKAVGGVKTSQHCNGTAADIKVGGKADNIKLFNFIKDMITKGEIFVGQLIDEYNGSWIHVSLPREGKKNNQIFSIK